MIDLIYFLMFSAHSVWACGTDLTRGAIVETVRWLQLKRSSQ